MFYNICMLIKKLYQGQKDIKEDIGTLLVEAFPEEERPPVKYFFQSVERKGNNLFGYYLNDEFIGFTYVTLYQDVCYLFFLAVKEDKRHKGYGGEILEDIKKSYPDYVILLCFEEIDPKYPNYEERIKRKNFYYSHGFKDNKMKTNEFGVIFETAFIGKHQVDFPTYVEIFVLGFSEYARKHIELAS